MTAPKPTDWRGPPRLGRKSAQRDAERSKVEHPDRNYSVVRVDPPAGAVGDWYQAVRHAQTEED